ncbi:glycosyltransferase family 2 protein [Roseibium suaedae]|uniref:Glycosyltransferase, catalytic subunit of cellulose synthase and poly-beta-1,6-N-acetylglucosamine synthase n=1 Tax=Roseibium suaedae TaxID=735517 RepID=A0A1M7BBX5_9HYPH|nr:glycosyltransferase [Roseibium suaedae]SHL52490.1 Glycosyltransferase, catalytic subunit of cellulose synthase and poly-beta-1,6-N-acetylglucosamine synthase [Roseibium suaedae]
MRQAPELGMTAAEYLVCKAVISEASIYSAMAEYCGIPFIPDRGFRPQSVNSIPVGLGSLDHGPLLTGVGTRQPFYVIAPEFSEFDQVKAHLERYPHLAGQVRMTTPSSARHASTILNSPAGDLESRFPHYSAKSRLSQIQLTLLLTAIAAFLLGMLVPPILLIYLTGCLFALNCAATGLVRLLSAYGTHQHMMDYRLPEPFSDPMIRWPVYTVLVPLYREASVVEDLIKGLGELDYPADRLEILFLLERDDPETRQAFLAHRLPEHMQVVLVPDGMPRTKPRALAHGLEKARGELITIYDAEDRPEPDQLKKAAVFFSLAPHRLACLQARLAIDNFDESFFSRQFALEYACLFDQVLPWFHQKSWPFPLGGTSNHFRRSVLEAVGGWDRYNVTEYADLGVRLARFGYRIGVLPSTTFEEAPLTWQAWRAQRTRWFKGWMQTFCVHLRDPRQIWLDLGSARCGVLLAMIAGSFLMMALHPFILLIMGGYFAGLAPVPGTETLAEKAFLTLCISSMFLGYTGAAVAAWLAGKKRGYRPNPLDLLLVPVYWACASAAFYCAVWEFFTRPFQWNKTAHGLSSRRGVPGRL